MTTSTSTSTTSTSTSTTSTSTTSTSTTYFYPEDPIHTIDGIIETISITKDDLHAPATINYQFIGGPEPLKTLLDANDVVVIKGKPYVIPARHIQNAPTFYVADYPIHVYTTDRYTAGVLVCTGTKAKWRFRYEMRRVIAANAIVGVYTLRIKSERENNKWVAGRWIWETIYTIEYKAA